MRIIIPGGTGQLGTILARSLHQQNHEVVVLSRSPQPRPWRTLAWDGRTLGAWANEVNGADVVINLAGRSVNCRYTPENRRAIVDSRVESTSVVGHAITRAARPPRIWLQASTATIYSHRYDAPNDERCGAIGGDEADAPESWHFSIEVARAWEGAFNAANAPHTRKVALRSAMTMTAQAGGIFDTLMGLVQRGLGGPVGDGRQYMSWIHHLDFARAVDWLIAHDQLSGVVNLTSPHPVPHAAFMRALRQVAHPMIAVPVTKWMLRIGTMLMRTEAELILKSRRVVPTRLLESGFTFRYPTWPEAARDLYAEWRAAKLSPQVAA